MPQIGIEKTTHLTDEDLAFIQQLLAEEGWTSEVIEPEIHRKGAWEVWLHVGVDTVLGEDSLARLREMCRYITAAVTHRKALRGETPPRRTRAVGERGEPLAPADLTESAA